MMIDKESSGTIVFRLGGNIMVNTDRMTAEMIKVQGGKSGRF